MLFLPAAVMEAGSERKSTAVETAAGGQTKPKQTSHECDRGL